MRKIEKRAVICMALAILLAAGMSVFLIKYFAEGGKWASSAFNRHLYDSNGVLISGTVLDRDGDVLSSVENGHRTYYENETVRKATLHAVGDLYGKIGTGVLNAFADKLTGFDLVNGAFGAERGSNLYLTLDARYNYEAYRALGGHAGTVAVYNYKTGEILCMVSAPSYDPLNIPKNLEENDRYKGAYLNRFLSSALTAGGEVITSRGELVEIGGSFRMPDVMAACGAVLREVGSTNKTRLSDYANAISEQTRALLKVHTSNYRIVGFTESVSPAALAELGRSRSIPVIEDLGSGCLVDLAPLGLRDEPTVQASVKAGVDVLSFSGDKLLGGPQAGIIVGKRHCIDLLKRHPLARALRVDKLTLAALEATLQAYADGTALQEIPVLSMLAQTPEELHQQAESLCRRMGGIGVTAEVVSTENPVGGGAVPTQTLPSFAVAVVPRDSAAALEAQLRQRPVPIIVRIAHDRCLLDMRTLFPADLDEILQAFRETAS